MLFWRRLFFPLVPMLTITQYSTLNEPKWTAFHVLYNYVCVVVLRLPDNKLWVQEHQAYSCE